MDTTSLSERFATQLSLKQQGRENRPGPPAVTDAINYVTSVKLQLAEQPEVYHQFLSVLQDFRNKRIDSREVTERISTLLRGYPDLIRGFNVFCPPSLHIDAGDNNVADPNAPGMTATVTHATNLA